MADREQWWGGRTHEGTFTFHETRGSLSSLNAIVAQLKNCPFGVVPILHSVSELTILYSKVIRVYIYVGYVIDFVDSR